MQHSPGAASLSLRGSTVVFGWVNRCSVGWDQCPWGQRKESRRLACGTGKKDLSNRVRPVVASPPVRGAAPARLQPPSWFDAANRASSFSGRTPLRRTKIFGDCRSQSPRAFLNQRNRSSFFWAKISHFPDPHLTRSPSWGVQRISKLWFLSDLVSSLQHRRNRPR